MALLSKEAILAAVDLKREEVEVPQWGGSVLVQELTGKQRGLFQSQILEQRKTGNVVRLEQVEVRLCAMSIVGENGARLFSDADVAQLAMKGSGSLQLVYQVAARLSGLNEEQVKELQGNSEETPSGDSPSDSL